MRFFDCVSGPVDLPSLFTVPAISMACVQRPRSSSRQCSPTPRKTLVNHTHSEASSQFGCRCGVVDSRFSGIAVISVLDRSQIFDKKMTRF